MFPAARAGGSGRGKTAFGAAFRRIARPKGAAVAVFATARQLARLIYRMLGHDYAERRSERATAAITAAAVATT